LGRGEATKKVEPVTSYQRGEGSRLKIGVNRRRTTTMHTSGPRRCWNKEQHTVGRGDAYPKQQQRGVGKNPVNARETSEVQGNQLRMLPAPKKMVYYVRKDEKKTKKTQKKKYERGRTRKTDMFGEPSGPFDRIGRTAGRDGPPEKWNITKKKRKRGEKNLLGSDILTHHDLACLDKRDRAKEKNRGKERGSQSGEGREGKMRNTGMVWSMGFRTAKSMTV